MISSDQHHDSEKGTQGWKDSLTILLIVLLKTGEIPSQAFGKVKATSAHVHM